MCFDEEETNRKEEAAVNWEGCRLPTMNDVGGGVVIHTLVSFGGFSYRRLAESMNE